MKTNRICPLQIAALEGIKNWVENRIGAFMANKKIQYRKEQIRTKGAFSALIFDENNRTGA